MGVERLWAEAKRRYRKELDIIKAKDLRFDQMGLVQTIMDSIGDNQIVKFLKDLDIEEVYADEKEVTLLDKQFTLSDKNHDEAR